LKRASGGIESPELIRAAIVNPARLAPERRDDVCSGCHLQPAVALPGLRRFGRGDYSFRPGEALTDYLVPVDVTEEGKAPDERFEINHHAYRLRRSLCFTQSTAGKLSCLTCHDPHRKVPAAERAAHYRAACLSCHQTEDGKLAAAHGAVPAVLAVATADCVACHMPNRRPQDVVHVVMTDHKIVRRPTGDPLAPLVEEDPVLTGISLYFPERSPPGAEGELYRALSVARTGVSAPGTDRVASLLAKGSPHPTALLELGQSQLSLRRFADAEATLSRVLAAEPDHPLALDWLAVARASQGRIEEGVALLRKALARSGRDRTETRFNLARLLAGLGEQKEAHSLLSQAVAERPNFAAAWYHKGNVEAELGDSAAAVASYRRALAVEPGYTPGYLALGRLLAARDERDEALRVLRHGKIVAARPDAVAEALAGMEEPPRQD
jgi:Tfp pilus assembly protein PilF